MLFVGCELAEEDFVSLNPQKTEIDLGASTTIPEKIEHGGAINLTFEVKAQNFIESEKFQIKAFSDGTCSSLAGGGLSADETQVTSVNGQVAFSNIQYTKATQAQSEKINIGIVSSLTGVVFCSTPIKINIQPLVLGQPDFVTNTIQSTINEITFGRYEYKLHSDGHKLFVADYRNSRVLIWNTIPTSILQAADVVLGQDTFLTNTCNLGGLSASSICRPGGVFSDGQKLFVVDYSNHRVLIWNTIPTINKTPADVVLGQPNMTSNTSNNGGISAVSMSSPWHLYVAAGKLLVSDYGNNRILIWNTIPTTSATAADVVVGQTNMSLNVDGYASPSDSNMSWPYEVTSDGHKLIVADSGNNRVLIWNSIPTTNGVAADVQIGQSNFSSNQYNYGLALPTEYSVGWPSSVYTFDGKLYVSDGGNARILIYDSIPTTNQAAANRVFGQPDFISKTANNGGISKDTISYVEGLYIDQHRAILGDAGNNRILVLPSF